MKKKQKPSGFTLIELMIVIVILGILFAALLPVFVRSKYQSQLAGCQFNLRAIAAAAENYHTANKFYPTTAEGINKMVFAGGYITRTPKCPAGDTEYSYEASDDGHNYTVSCEGGLHHLVLPNCQEGYPKFNPGRGVFTDN